MKRMILILAICLSLLVPSSLLATGITFDSNKPLGSETLSTHDDYIRETRSQIADFAVQEHYLNGLHKFPSTTTSGLSALTNSAGRIVYNSTTGSLLFGTGSAWVGTNGAINVPYALSSTYSNDLTVAVATIGATATTLYIDQPVTLSAHTVVPKTLTLSFLAAGKVTLGNFNLTLNCTVRAPSQKIFDYTGGGVVIRGASGPSVFLADWFGALGDGTNDYAAIVNTINAHGSLVGDVVFEGKTYTTSGTILTVPANIILTFNAGSKLRLVDHDVVFNGYFKSGPQLQQLFIYTGAGIAKRGSGGIATVYPEQFGVGATGVVGASSFFVDEVGTIKLTTGDYAVTSVLAFTNATLDFARGTRLSIGNGSSAAISKFITPQTPQTSQIFTLTGTGVVTLTTELNIFPELWYSGSGDYTDAFNAAVTAASEGASLVLSAKTYSVSPLSITKKLNIKGPCRAGLSSGGGAIIAAIGNQTHTLKLGAVGVGTRISGPQIENVMISGGGFTLSDAALVLENLSLLDVSKSHIGNVIGRAVRMRDVREPKFNQVLFRTAGVPGGEVIYFDNYYGGVPTQGNCNNVYFGNNCQFEGLSGDIFKSYPDVACLDILRVIDCKFEHGAKWQGSSVPPHAIFNLYGTRIVVRGNTYGNFNNGATYDSYDTLAILNGYSHAIEGNFFAACKALKITLGSGDDSGGISIKDNIDLANSTAFVLANSAIGGVTYEPLAISNSGAFGGRLGEKHGPFIAAKDLDTSGTANYYVADATSLSLSQSVRKAVVTGTAKRLINIPLQYLSGYPTGVDIWVRVKSKDGSGGITGWVTGPVTIATYTAISNTDWEWKRFHITYAQLTTSSIYTSTFRLDTDTVTDDISFDGVYFEPGNGFITLADSATPSVKGGNKFITGGTTTITNFTDGYDGQEITIVSAHAVTLTDGTYLVLRSSTDYVMASSDTIRLVYRASNDKWYQIGGEDNS